MHVAQLLYVGSMYGARFGTRMFGAKARSWTAVDRDSLPASTLLVCTMVLSGKDEVLHRYCLDLRPGSFVKLLGIERRSAQHGPQAQSSLAENPALLFRR